MPIPLSPQALRRTLIWGGVLVALVVAYAVFGFVGVPHILRSQATQFVQQKYGRVLTLGEVRFNPFTLELTLTDFALPDADGQPMLGAHRLYVNPQLLRTIWNRGATLADVELEKPLVRARMRADGNLNLLDLTRPFPPDNTSKSSMPRFFLGRLLLSQGDVSYEDLGHPNLHAAIAPLNFQLRDFNTLDTGANGYTLNFATPQAEQFHWQGNLDASPVASKGTFQVQALKVSTLARLAGDSAPVVIESPSGVVQFDGAYDFSTAGGKAGLLLDLHKLTVSDVRVRTRTAPLDEVKLAGIELADLHFDLLGQAAKLGSLAVTDIGIRPARATADYVSLPRIQVDQTQVDLAHQSAQVAAVKITGGHVDAWRDATGINLLALAATGPAAHEHTAKPAAAARAARGGGKSGAARATATTSATEATPGWRVEVGQAGIEGLKVDVEDHTTRPAAKFMLAPLNVSVAGVKWPMQDPLDVTADTGLDGSGHLAARASVAPAGTVKAHVELSKFDLKAVQPYVAQFTSLSLMSGMLGAKLDVDVGGKRGLVVGGDVDVNSLRTIDDSLKKDLVRWNSLKVEGLKYQQTPAELAIRSIDTDGLYARAILAANKTFNISEALRPAGSPAPAPAPAPAAPAAAKAGTAASRPAPLCVANQPAAAADAMAVRIDAIRIHNGSANYADEWIQPNFAIGIQTLAGSIEGLSSDPASRAKIELTGQVDKYAPVHIWGEANPLAATLYTDVHMDFTGIDLTSINPYSGRFAGYKINKGKLTTQLAYKVDNCKLDASHHVVVDQLELGDRVDSPDAMHLPLKLAVALLRDRHGVIDLDLPISGTLDDPKFRIGPIIWQVFTNIITKAVTAPFSLLGHLFGGGDHVNLIAFPPGSAVLDDAGHTQVSNIAKGLTERPGLELDIPATYANLDRQALALRQLRLSLAGGNHGRRAPSPAPVAAAGGAAAGVEAADAAATAADATDREAAQALAADPEQYYGLLLAAYKKQAGKGELPPAVAAVTEAKKSKATPDYAAAIAELEPALLQDIKVDPARLENLGLRRARAVQDALLGGTGIDPARVFVTKGGAEQQATDNKVTLEIKLKQ